MLDANDMALQGDAFAEPVRGILLRCGTSALPLTRGGKCNDENAATIRGSAPASLFPDARAPEAAVSGLLLLLGCWEESHELSQGIDSREGSYWHAIGHRIEPDSANSGYWFRRVGEHPIFAELHRRALEILQHGDAPDWHLKPAWDPFLFIAWCDEARSAPDTAKEHLALKIQRAEWELLFEWCALEPH
ncbi:MAG: hypothetical protein WB992_05760 [Bryobacteraceae bacterium]